METKEKQIKSKVQVQVAKCPKCNGNVKLAVLELGETLDKQTAREYAKLMVLGCSITTISLDDARKEKLCFMDCDKKKIHKKPLKKNRV